MTTPKTEEKKDEAKSPSEVAAIEYAEAARLRVKELEAELAKLKPANGPALAKTSLASTELAPLAADVSMMLEPRSMKEAKDLAIIMAEAQLVPSPAVGLVLLMRGRPLGLDAMTCATKMFAVPNEKTGTISVGMYADLILALTRKHPACDYIELEATTDQECTFVGKRKGAKKETRVTWTLERAKRADLLDRGADEGKQKRNNWNRYPENMLRARATSEICKIVCPEATMGIESIEVLRDERDTITVEAEIVKPAKPARDFAREVDELKLAISGAKTKSDKEELVRKIGAADLPEEHMKSLREAYAARFAPKKSDREPGEEG